jgi:hypothetical protein
MMMHVLIILKICAVFVQRQAVEHKKKEAIDLGLQIFVSISAGCYSTISLNIATVGWVLIVSIY